MQCASVRSSRLILALLFLMPLYWAQNASGQTASDWQLVWSDNFAGPAGSAPNPNNWTLQQGLTADGAQSYNCLYGQTTNGCNPATPNVYLDGNNHLIIKALAAAGAPNGVTTGRVFTTNSANTVDLFSTQYGRIEAQMVLPAGSGNQGVWPAFWMLGTNIPAVNWPSCGEMDIMEYIGAANETQIYSTLHGQAYANEGLGVRDTIAGGWSGTHTFGAIWSPNQISFYVDEITNIYGTISTADIMADQSWVNGGLASWPFNNPMFIIFDLNMGGPFPGNVSAATTYPQVLQVNYVNVYHATPPGPPTNVTATATSQSQVALNWTGSTNTDATYNVYRSQTFGTAPLSQAQPNAGVLPQTNQTLIANNITGTTYTDANLSPGQTYYYTVTASGNYSGESAASQVQATTLPAGNVGANGGAIYVSAAGYSGEGAYIVNTLVSGGFTNAFTTTENTSGVSNPAPQDVYHSERWGPQTWTIAHLTPGGSYNVRMHFAESAWTAAGQREFNVLINGQQVLTNFDIFATAGGQNKVITQTINTVADRNGVVYLQLAAGAADQPEIRALDVTPSTGGTAYGLAAGTMTYVAIDAGGPGGEAATTGTFEADEDAGNFGLPANPITAGGGTNTTTQTISTAGVTNAAPEAVYQTERYGAFGYIFTGLVANSTYTVRLHLAEGVADYNVAGRRQFNVAVNGNQVLTNYDIFANAGALYQAVIPQVTGVSDEHGILSVQFTPSYDDLPSIRGIEVIQSSTPTAATPTFTPAAGTYTTAQTVTISDATAGAKIYYTTNGTTPTTASAVYSGPITVSATETLEALAVATGYNNSAVAAATYTFSTPTAATPTFTPAAGTYATAQTVTISDATAGAKIYYTTNGTTPTTASAVYSGPLTVSATETIEALAIATGYNNSAVATATYTITTTGEGPYGGTAAAIPGTVLAENYDTGGQGVGYNVTAVNGTDNSYRSDSVDLEVTSATGGGNDLGWTAAGQWFRYTVNVATAGTYAVTFEVAAPTAVTDGFHLSNSSGTNLSGLVNVPATGGWQTWTPVTATVTLPAGRQVLTLNQDNAGWNIYSTAFVLTTTQSGTDVLDISAGGTAASGSYVADEDYAGGAAAYTSTTISTAGVTNPAPEAVYQHQRFGNFTYTLPGFTAGTTYLVRLHFDEFYWTAAGKREFNVLINGTQVLTDFDVFATAGGEDIATVKQFSAVANSSGQIVIQFVSVVDNAEVNGIEIETSGPSVTATPTFSPVAGSYTGAQTVTITDTTSGAKIYYTTNGSTPTTSSAVYSAPITVSASETIEAIATASGFSNSAVATAAYIITPNVGTDVIAINSGGPAVTPFVADEYFTGGAESTFPGPVSTTGIPNPPPAAIFLTQRFGNTFSYAIPNLTPGANYTVLLYFAESYWTAAGKRVFSVSINGTAALTNFDIFATAGGENIGIVKSS